MSCTSFSVLGVSVADVEDILLLTEITCDVLHEARYLSETLASFRMMHALLVASDRPSLSTGAAFEQRCRTPLAHELLKAAQNEGALQQRLAIIEKRLARLASMIANATEQQHRANSSSTAVSLDGFHAHLNFLSHHDEQTTRLDSSSIFCEVVLRERHAVRERWSEAVRDKKEYERLHYLKQPAEGWANAAEAEAHLFGEAVPDGCPAHGPAVCGVDELVTSGGDPLVLPGLVEQHLRSDVSTFASCCGPILCALIESAGAKGGSKKRQRDWESQSGWSVNARRMIGAAGQSVSRGQQELQALDAGLVAVYYVSTSGAVFFGGPRKSGSGDSDGCSNSQPLPTVAQQDQTEASLLDDVSRGDESGRLPNVSRSVYLEVPSRGFLRTLLRV